MVTAAASQEPLNENGGLSFRVDTEHAGIRAGCVVFAFATLISFGVFSLLMPEASVLVLILSLVTGAAISYAVENQLKSKFATGRTLKASDDIIEIARSGAAEMSIDPRKQVNVLAWRFEVPRSGRIKKGWYVVALGLEQDDNLLSFYTFSAPDRFKDVPLSNHFEPLQKADKISKDTGSAREMKLAGQQRRLHEAEKMRHMQGAELALEDFEQLLDHLQDRYPAWMLR